MSSINEVDHKVFIPIKIDNSSQISFSNGDPAPSSNNANFQRILQTLLMNRDTTTMAAENGIRNSEDPLLMLLMMNNKAIKKQLLGETLETNFLTQSLGQTGLIPKAQGASTYKAVVDRFKQELGMEAMDKMNSGKVSELADSAISKNNPTKQQIIDYISEQCELLGIPKQLGLATAATESAMTQFGKDGNTYHSCNANSSDWGIMQVNDKAWGRTFDFNRIKNDWQYNVRAGLQILKDNYQAAINNNEGIKGENGMIQNLARSAYSGYNAGTSTIWRYRTPIHEAPKGAPYGTLDIEGYDLRDKRFWEWYQRFI